jgi:outer membrane protein assembly factor BamB
MPADLDELFTALGTHADRIPVGTSEGARRRGRRRRGRLVVSGLALAVLGTSGAVGIARLPVPPAPPAPPAATPAPTVDFAPLVRTGTVPMSLETAGIPSSLIVDGVAYVMAGQTPVRVGALDLATGEPAFPTVDLGAWDTPPYGLQWGPAGLVATGVPAGATNRVLIIIDPTSGAVRWQLELGDDVSLLSTRPAVVTHARSGGLLRGLDWHTGTELWRREVTAGDATLVGDYPVGPWLPASHSDVALGSDRLLLADDALGSVLVIDARTGETLRRIANDRSRDATIAIDGTLYSTRGAELWAQSVDRPGEPTLVYRDPDGRSVGVDLCGAVLCVRVGERGGHRLVLLDPATHREITSVSAANFGIAVGDRFLTYQGLLLDLTGTAVGETPRSTRRAWWITAGSALTVTYPDPEWGEVVGLQTADGTPVLLGEIPLIEPGGCAIDARYLVCPAPDGFHAWQFAEGPTR